MPNHLYFKNCRYDGAFVNGAKDAEIVPFKQKQIEQYIKIWFTNAAAYIDNDVTRGAA